MARPKAFNPTDALDQALRLFQVTGYLGTSMDDLVRAMGISRASLYDTFDHVWQEIQQERQQPTS